MATTETGVYISLSASASMNRITTNGGAGGGGAITASGDNQPIATRPQGQGQVHGPCLELGDFASYFWQALGLASAFAVSPIVIYAFLKATCFLFTHVKLFGWAWIICFLISFFLAIYFENCGAGAGPSGLMDNLQQSVGVAVSYMNGCDPVQGHHGGGAASSAPAQGSPFSPDFQVEGATPAHGHAHLSHGAKPFPQGQAQGQGSPPNAPQGTRQGSGPNAGIGGLQTQAGVFNTDTEQNSAADIPVSSGGQGQGSSPSSPRGTRLGSGPNAAIGGLQTQAGIFNTDTEQNSAANLPVGVGKGQRASDAYNSSQNSSAAFPDGTGPGSRKQLGSLDSSTGGARLVTPPGKVFNRDPTGTEEVPLPS